MNKFFLLILVVFLASCIQPIFHFPEIPNMGFETTQEVLDWVATNVRYTDDVIHYPQTEYWQSALQTYVWKFGDCEDFTILAMYLLNSHFGMKPRMATGYLNGGGHAWLEINGVWYEPQDGIQVWPEWGYQLYQYIGYDEVMKRSTTKHRTQDDQ